MPQAPNPGTKHAPQTWAIYHPLEAQVAEALAKTGEVVLLDPADVPDILQVNNTGESVLCAAIVPGEKLAKFHRMLSDAYAA